MASGRCHDWATKKIAVPSAIGMGLIVYPIAGLPAIIPAFLFTFFGLMAQRIMSPDLDQQQITFSEYLVNRLNPIVGKMWEMYWWAYSAAIPHRHFISHFPIISTIIRIIYLFLPFYLLSFFDIKPLKIFFDLAFYYWDYSLYFILGMIIADIGHYCLDYNYWLKNKMERIVAKQYRRKKQ